MHTPLPMGALLMAGTALALVAGQARAQSCPDPETTAGLTDCVTVEGAFEHLQAWQDIADANGGTRVSGTSGYDQSVTYVAETLEAAGYDVTLQSFPFNAFINLGNSVLARKTSPDPTFYEEGADFSLLSQTDPGSAYGRVTAVDVALGLGNESTSGCEPEDYDGFPEGHIALVQRGTCTFQIKAENAAAAGAEGVIIFNQGNSEDRFGLINATLGNEYVGGIPVVFATYELGTDFLGIDDLRLRIRADVFRGEAMAENVIAELPGENPDNVVAVGAHLDSVEEGPGIQDNGSGSAAILETALQMAGTTYPNTVRFLWWGAEESGLVGSTYYVDQLSEEEIEEIALYLNFDMVASPNWFYGVYDGDDSDLFGEGPGPEGSAEIEQAFEAFYDERGVPYKGTDFSGRSDYGPFIAVGIPAGGLFTGAEEIKTEAEVEIWGGTAGEQYDPCYHEACDVLENVALEPLGVNIDAVAAVTLKYAQSTEEVNGVGDGGLSLVAAVSASSDGGFSGAAVGAVETEMLGDMYRK